MSPSPMRAEYQRWPMASSALTRARAATTPATAMTTPVSRGRMPRSMMVLSSSGMATVATADSVVMPRNTASWVR